MATILIIDDDKLLCKTMSRVVTNMGHRALEAHTFEDGLSLALSNEVDIVFLDVRLPDANGIEKLPEVRSTPSEPEVIIITGFAGPDGAELAIKGNAWDYIRKPASLDAITLTLNRAIEYRKKKFADGKPLVMNRNGIVGSSRSVVECLDLAAKAATNKANIILSGETGTGKELFARAIHVNSPRANRNFVVVDCAALPKNLIESILFGYTKGAFTGAERSEDGLVKHADGGTLFLDEVGELTLATQKTFLRVLQERRFRPLGSPREVESDFRLVAATHRDLDQMVAEGHFREDLLFRLRSVSIHLPPLRERAEDIRELAVHYVMRLCESNRVGIKGFSPECLEIMNSYGWPGNVRELFSAMEYAITEAYAEQTLLPQHLPTAIRVHAARSVFSNDFVEIESETQKHSSRENPAQSFQALFRKAEGEILPKWKIFRKRLIEKGEMEYVNELIRHAGEDRKKACEISGLSLPRLYELLRKYSVKDD